MYIHMQRKVTNIKGNGDHFTCCEDVPSHYYLSKMHSSFGYIKLSDVHFTLKNEQLNIFSKILIKNINLTSFAPNGSKIASLNFIAHFFLFYYNFILITVSYS